MHTGRRQSSWDDDDDAAMATTDWIPHDRRPPGCQADPARREREDPSGVRECPPGGAAHRGHPHGSALRTREVQLAEEPSAPESAQAWLANLRHKIDRLGARPRTPVAMSSVSVDLTELDLAGDSIEISLDELLDEAQDGWATLEDDQLPVMEPTEEPRSLDALRSWAALYSALGPLPELTASLAARSDSNLYAGFDPTQTSGVFVATSMELPIGAAVFVTVHLPVDQTFRAAAVVEWVSRSASGRTSDTAVGRRARGLGLRLLALGPRERELIERYGRQRAPFFFEP